MTAVVESPTPRGRQRPAPIDHERSFAAHELFFSTTDAKGIITSGNDVFVRVSAYALDDLLGAAHNIIRHPDMPRAVFAVLWEYLERGETIAAYVKNLAADGAFYWVMALVVPLPDGYLSVRLKPSEPLLAAAEAIYADVLATEQRVENGDVRRRRDAIAAGVQRLQQLLADAGYADYTAFMHEAFSAEVTARQRRASTSALGQVDAQGDTLGEAAASSLDAERALREMVDELAHSEHLAVELREKSRFVFGLAEEIELFALNAVLSAARLGDEGTALAAVASILGRRSGESAADIRTLNGRLAGTADHLSGMRFRVAGGALMAEMARQYLDGLRDSGAPVATCAVELRALSAGLVDAANEMAAAVDAFMSAAAEVETAVARVDAHLRAVRALEVNGQIEGARLNDTVVTELFVAISHQIEEAREQLQGFHSLSEVANDSQMRCHGAVTVASATRAAELVDLLSAGRGNTPDTAVVTHSS